ncbi:MAG: EsaB/YukD family protein [Lachnospiraceae bacterium]|nr:EsaB/YukD family protein [Lachnospiraceae bacterium]
MILVDIYVPSVNEQYDFKVDENAYIANVVEEIGDILTAGHTKKEDAVRDLILCDAGRGAILPMDQTLKQNGIGNGSRLMLI